MLLIRAFSNKVFISLEQFQFTAKLRGKCRDFPYVPYSQTGITPCYQLPHQSDTSVTTDEPVLTHHNYQKSTVHIMVHSWCCTFYGFGQIYNNSVYPSLSYHTKYFHCLKNICCVLPVHPFLPPSINPFIVPIVLSFLEWHIAGTIQYLAFQIGFFYLVICI